MSGERMPATSLAVLPFIDVVDRAGRGELLSVGGVLERADEVRLAGADPLLWAATARLLAAVAYTAGCGPDHLDGYCRQVFEGVDLGPAVGWVREHAADLDLFHPQWPVFQDGSLARAAGRGAGVAVQYLDLTAAIRRPLLSDRRHLHVHAPVSAARAAGLLLIQQMWCPGGRISASEAVYGKGCNYGRPAPACGGVVLQPDGTVAQMLAWRLVPLPGRQAGTARWTYTPRDPAPGPGAAADEDDGVVPDGEADALTWHHRRILLIRRGDGLVDRAMFAQGELRIAGMNTLPATDRPGCRDLATTEDGGRLSAEAVTGEEDVAPLLHSWWNAPGGSWAHTARQAAATGCGLPDVRATALTTVKNKKLVNRRHVFLPGSLLADPRGRNAAACIVRIRRKTTTAAAGFGSAYLHEEAFMNATDEQRALMMQPTAVPGLNTPSGHDSLFTTVVVPADEAAERADEPEDPVDMLTRKLGGWARSAHTRDLMGQLARWAVRPSPANDAYPRVTRLLPDRMHHAGMLTAALFAVHRQQSAAPYGNAPLPRLMRAFGTGHRRGPQHLPTRQAMTLMLRTAQAEELRLLLLRQIRYAAAQQMTPDWSALMRDLAQWGPAVQERWHTQFYTRQPLPPHSS